MHGFQVAVHAGEILTIIGGNGTGKSTALKVFAGLEKPYRGNVFVNGKKLGKYSKSELYRQQLAVLPQDPKTLFVEKKVKQELEHMADAMPSNLPGKLQDIIDMLDLQHLLDRHPYDFSGGEQQKLALAKLLLLDPKYYCSMNRQREWMHMQKKS